MDSNIILAGMVLATIAGAATYVISSSRQASYVMPYYVDADGVQRPVSNIGFIPKEKIIWERYPR